MLREASGTHWSGLSLLLGKRKRFSLKPNRKNAAGSHNAIQTPGKKKATSSLVEKLDFSLYVTKLFFFFFVVLDMESPDSHAKQAAA